MDNTARYGFRHIRSMYGATPSLQDVRVATGYQAAPGGTNVDLHIGDPVTLLSTGYVQQCAVGGAIYGVIMGVLPYWDGTKKVFDFKLPGGTAYGTVLDRTSRLLVMPAEGQVFEVDCDDNTTATTEAAYTAFFGENADHSFTASASEKKAYPKLDISTHNTTNTLGWRILDFAKIPGMDLSGANVKLEVTANVVRQAPYVITGV